MAAAMRLFYSVHFSDGREARNPVVIYITWWTTFVLLSSCIVPLGSMRESVFGNPLVLTILVYSSTPVK
jgi:hypothetical protein